MPRRARRHAQKLQTRTASPPATAAGSDLAVQREQKMRPHTRQWCRRTSSENGRSQS
jgi:hypothetical protein